MQAGFQTHLSRNQFQIRFCAQIFFSNWTIDSLTSFSLLLFPGWGRLIFFFWSHCWPLRRQPRVKEKSCIACEIFVRQHILLRPMQNSGGRLTTKSSPANRRRSNNNKSRRNNNKHHNLLTLLRINRKANKKRSLKLSMNSWTRIVVSGIATFRRRLVCLWKETSACLSACPRASVCLWTSACPWKEISACPWSVQDPSACPCCAQEPSVCPCNYPRRVNEGRTRQQQPILKSHFDLSMPVVLNVVSSKHQGPTFVILVSALSVLLYCNS